MNLSIFNFKMLRMLFAVVGFFLLMECVFRICFFGSEAIYNFWDYSPRAIGSSEFIIEDSNQNIVYKLVANKKGRFKSAQFTTNSFGFRGKETTIDKQEGVYRIVLLGSSIDMGAGVSDELTYSSQLQKKFDQVMPHQIEILNFAVGGYKPSQMEASFWDHVEQFKPDLILLPVHVIVFNNYRPPNQITSPPAYQLRPYLRSFFSLQWINYATGNILKNIRRKGWFGNDENWKQPSRKKKKSVNKQRKGRATHGQVLYRFVTDLKVANYAVVIIRLPRPTPEPPLGGPRREKIWSNWLQFTRPSFSINTYPELRGQISLKDGIYPGDVHPNSSAHALYAESIFKSLWPFVKKSMNEKNKSQTNVPIGR